MNNPFEVNQFALWVTLRGISKGAFEEINESLSGGAYCFGETLRASLAPLAASPSQAHPLRLPPG